MRHTWLLLATLALACGEPKPEDSAPPEADADTDADTDADSDADSDADTDIATESDCDDGLDDDGDGLVDCEDGDCAEAEHCEELICDDGLDNEGDGLTDCEDDDCWGPHCHPLGVKVQATGGNLWRRASYIGERREGGYTWDRHWHTTEATLRSTATGWASGVVRVLPSGASGWGEGSTMSCDWSVASASLGRSELRYRNYWGGSVQVYPWQHRAGLTIEPGCRLDSTWFMPQTLFLGSYLLGKAVYTDYWEMSFLAVPGGARWYIISGTTGTTRRTSTTWSSVRTEDRWSVQGTTFARYRSSGFAVYGGEELLALP